MSGSLPIDVANAIAAEINAQSQLSNNVLGAVFTAVRAYRPQFDLVALKELRVSVVPRSIVIEMLDRRSNQNDVSVDVAVQQKVDPDDTQSIDALMVLVQKIADYLRLKRLTLVDGTSGATSGGGASGVWIKTENVPIYSPEQLETKQVFTSVLTFTYRVVK